LAEVVLDRQGKARIPASAVIALCAAVAMLEGYDIQAMGVAAPKMMPALGLDQAQAGWALSANMIGLIVGSLIGGRLADRIGRRPVLVGSVLAFGAFSLATIAAKGFAGLVAIRIAVGLGLGGAMPNLIAIASEVTPFARRTAVTTLVFCGMSLGGAVSALLALYAPLGLDWRIVFVMGGTAPLMIAPLIAFLLPETRIDHVDGEPQGAGGVIAALFGEGRAASTLPLWAAYALTLVILYLMLNWLPLLAAAKGMARADAPLASVAFNLTSLVGAPLLGMLVDRGGVRWPMTLAYMGLALSIVALSRAAGAGPIIALAGLAGFLVIGVQFCLYGLSPSYYLPAERGTGAGAAVAVGRLGSIAGPLIAGYLLKAGASAELVVWSMAPVAMLAGGAVWLLSAIGKRITD
jgi:AAHS family 3-hydroxyphenylpropionic acid transporter